MSDWKLVEADEEMAARIRGEYGQIHTHLGDEAPDSVPACTREPRLKGTVYFRRVVLDVLLRLVWTSLT
jgi:hypothetical protein